MGEAVNTAANSVRNSLDTILDSLSEEKLIILLALALKVKEGMVIPETDETLTVDEVEMILASEIDYANNDWTWWRDAKRSEV